MQQRVLLSLLLTAGFALAQPAPVITSTGTQEISVHGFNGDTPQFTAWTASGGNFHDGRLLGSCNDCQIPFTPDGARRNIILLEMVRYDPVTPANTNVVPVNTMDSYGTPAQFCVDSTGGSCKSHDPFSLNGNLCWNVFVQDNGPPWDAHRSMVICSPDGGKHWCNYLSYITGLPNGAGSGGVPNSCGPANWSAAGDMPTSSAGIQWPESGDHGLNKMARLTLVQLCQDNTISCPDIPGLDTSRYVYFETNTQNGAHSYVQRLEKSCDAGPGNMPAMLPACWTHWDGKIWNANYTAGLDVGQSAEGIIYIPDSPQTLFLSFAQGAANSLIWTCSTSLFGPWSSYTTVTGANIFGGFATPLLPTYTKNADGSISLTIAGNDGANPGPLRGWLSQVNIVTSGMQEALGRPQPDGRPRRRTNPGSGCSGRTWL